MKSNAIDRPFLLTLAGLVAFGLLILLSASSPQGVQKFNDAWYFIKHQILFGLLPGTVLFAILSRMDYRKLRKEDQKTKVIVISAYSDEIINLHAENLKIEGFFDKPYPLEDLLEQVEKSIGGATA